MAPRTRGLRDKKVTKRNKVSFELIIGKNGSLFEAIHAFEDLDVDVPFGVKIIVGQGVLCNNLGSEIAAMDQDDTVEEELGVSDTNRSGRTNILVSIEAVAANRHANAVGFGLAGLHGADEIGISDLAASRNLMGHDKNHGVVATDLFAIGAGQRETLCTSAPLISKGPVPDERIDVFDFLGVRVVHFAGNDGVVVDGLSESSRVATMSAGIETETGKTSSGTLALEKRSETERRRRRERKCGRHGGGKRHPRK